MTTSLLVVREYIRNFYVKYEEYIVPVLEISPGARFHADD